MANRPMKNLKLNQLSSSSLSDMEMGQVKGGHGSKGNCACACKYAKSGGSSTGANGNANNKGGLHSSGMDSGNSNFISLPRGRWI